MLIRSLLYNSSLLTYNLGHLLQLLFPFFLYFLQHFFFLPPQLTSQFIAAQGEYKEVITEFCTSI